MDKAVQISKKTRRAIALNRIVSWVPTPEQEESIRKLNERQAQLAQMVNDSQKISPLDLLIPYNI